MKLALYLTIVLIIFSCSGNSSQSDRLDESKKTLEDLLEATEKEVQKEQEEFTFEVFENPKSIDSIRLLMESVIPAEYGAIDEIGIGKRYASGEKELKEEVLAILYADNVNKKKELIWDLHPSFEDQPFILEDRDIITALYDNLLIDSVELQVIYLIKNHELPGYLDRFEEHLLSGNSSEEGEIMILLGKEGKRMKTLDYFQERLSDPIFDNRFLSKSITGLHEFRRSENEAICKKVDEICLKIYHQGKIDSDVYEELDEEYAYDNPAKNLLEIFFEFGDKEVIPIANRFVHKQAVEYKALSFLIRMEGPKHRKKLIDLMKYEDTYFSGIKLVEDYYLTTKDERIIHSAITNFELVFGENFDENSWRIDSFLRPLRSFLKDSTANYIKGRFKDKELEEYVLKANRILAMSVQDILNYLSDWGFTDGFIKAQVRDKSFVGNNVFTALEESGVYFWFDSDEYDYEYEWDWFINSFIDHSLGKLEGMEFAVDYSDDQPIKVYAILNEMAYQSTFPSTDDYDNVYFDKTVQFINAILADIESEKSFQSIYYDSYIFGDKESVDQLTEDFQL